MANRSHVPQFGNWENQDNVPYTVFFDKARKGRTGTQMVNPNDPEDTRSVLSDNPDPVGAAPLVSRSRNEPTNPVRQGTDQSSHARVRSREEVGMRQYPDPSPNHENMANRNAREANLRSNRSEQSVDRSPLHRQAKGRDSPSWEGNRSYESNQGAPAKTRMKPSNNSRSDDSFDKAAAVPKFGGWNNDPTSAEGYTHIFNKVREERHAEPGREAEMRSPQPYYANTQTNSPVEKKICCFPWGRR